MPSWIRRTIGLAALVVILRLTASNGSAAITNVPVDIWDAKAAAELYTAKVLACPAPYDATIAAWDFNGQETWPLTFKDPNMKDLRVEDGRLKFTMGANKVVFGWGNYPPGSRKALKSIAFPGRYNQAGGATIEIRMCQTKPESTWKIEFRYRGDARDTGFWGPGLWMNDRSFDMAAQGTGTVWQTLVVPYRQVAEADGFGLEVRSQVGNEITLDSVKITQRMADVYARKTIVIPKGRVFSAMATVAVNADLWVNGTLVHAEEDLWGLTRYRHVSVDLKPYLKPEKNIIGLYEMIRTVMVPTCWLQGAIQMVSGETISLDTGSDWKTQGKSDPDWLAADFDDSPWLAPGDTDPLNYLKPKVMRPFLDTSENAAGNVPAYAGQVALENPYLPRLFYNSTDPVRLRVRLPAGLADRKPQMEYAVWDGENKRSLTNGLAVGGGRKGDALVYDIDLGRMERGVYTLLLDAGNVQNPQLVRQETFIVVGKIPMPETDGRAWDADMNLTLLEDIDCANTNDPHPFADAGIFKPEYASKIVTRNGLTYREAQATTNRVNGLINQYAWFSYKFKFRRLGQPHWVVVDYPDDGARSLEMQVVPLGRIPGIKGPYASYTAWVEAGQQVGGKYPNTGKMQTMRFLVWSHATNAAFFMTNAGEGHPAGAAAARIRVYAIEQLPALKTASGGRRFGLMTERCDTLMRTFLGAARGLGEEPQSKNRYINWLKTAERYAQYCRFTGQNIHFMGSYQYESHNEPSLALNMSGEGCRLIPEQREVYINVLGANGIETMASIEYWMDIRGRHQGLPALHQTAQGADLMVQVDRNGKVQLLSDNPMTSALARQSMLKNMDHILERFAIYPSFKGLAMFAAPDFSGPIYSSADVSFDDQTLRAFEKETGIHVPEGSQMTDTGRQTPDDGKRTTDMSRFGKRYAWLMANAKEPWFDWRSKKVAEVNEEIARRVKAARPDLDFFMLVEMDNKQIRDIYEKGKPWLEAMREIGYDPRVYAKSKRVALGRILWSFDAPRRGHGQGDREYGQTDYVLDPEVIRVTNQGSGASRVTFVRWGFDEWGNQPLLLADPAVWPGGYMMSSGTPAHRMLVQRFTQELINSDVDTIEYGFADGPINSGDEQELRRFVRAFVSIPKVRFERLRGQGLDRNICIAEAEAGKDYYIYVANPGWWDCKARLTLKGRGSAPIIDAVDGKPVTLPADGVLLVNLSPYGVAVFKGRARMLTPLGAETLVSEEAQTTIADRLAQCREKLADGERMKGLSADRQQVLRVIFAEAEAAMRDQDYPMVWHHLTRGVFYDGIQ